MLPLLLILLLATLPTAAFAGQVPTFCTSDACLSTLAKTTQDPAHCTTIKDGDQADICFAAIKDIKACDKLQKINRRRCTDAVHRQLANSKRDKKECPSIYNTKRKNQCFLDVARLTYDRNICAEINDTDLRSNCLTISPAPSKSVEKGRFRR